MDKTKRNLVFELVSFFCCLIVVIISASAMEGTLSKAQLLGIIAGSFGAGAAFANLIRNHVVRHSSGK